VQLFASSSHLDSAMTSTVHFETKIPSSTTEGLAVQEKLISLMERYEYSMRDVFAMRLSLEEGLTNAIRHGNKLDPAKNVTVNCAINNSKIRVVISDQGEGFDPEIVPDPTLEEFIERPCGRGLMLMRAYLNLCVYSDGGRCLTMERDRNSPLPIVED
jgi:serine/threonine-protein kinase RsbW